MLTPIVIGLCAPPRFALKNIWDVAWLQITEYIGEEVANIGPMEAIYVRVVMEITSALRENISAYATKAFT